VVIALDRKRPMNEEFYKELLDNVDDGVYFVDRRRVITYWNKGAERITGYNAERVKDRCCGDNLLDHVNAEGEMLCLGHCPLAATMEDGQPREANLYLRHAAGHRVPVRVRAACVRNKDGAIIGAVETFSNNEAADSARRRIQRLEQTTAVDELTGVTNRRHVEARLAAAMVEFRLTGLAFGVMFCDVDNFKEVNDTRGHATGDGVLRMVARTMRYNLRPADTVGRWGGEEFVIHLPETDTKAISVVAEKLRVLVSRSRLELADGGGASATISIGATVVHPDDSLETLIGRADRLMYASKQTGRNRCTIG